MVDDMSKRIQRLLLNYFSTMAFAWLAIQFYTLWNPYYTKLLGNWARWDYGNIAVVLSFRDIVWGLFWIYALALIPYYFLHPRMKSKAGLIVRALANGVRKREFPKSWPVRQAALALGLKFFFAPLMINWLYGHIIGLHHQWMGVLDFWVGYTFRVLFDAHLFWLLLQIILLADVLVFTLGYLVEIPALGNRIRSVEPTLFGWIVCLACYPPFNGWISQVIQWKSTDFPRFGEDWLHYGLNFSLLALMAVYTWASLALNLKASNLTNRGIISSGPYRFVRHPAYFCKNMAWWIGAVPLLYASYRHGNWANAVMVIISVGAWTLLYYLRAVTEERHLMRGHNGYREYAERVPYRFIPGVI